MTPMDEDGLRELINRPLSEKAKEYVRTGGTSDPRPEKEAPQKLYPANQLNSHDHGCLLDLRARLAIEFVKADICKPTIPPGAVYAGGVECDNAVGAAMAHFALNLAAELLKQADARGWVQPLPDHGELLQAERNHIERNAKAQVYGQMAAQRFGQEEAARIVPVHGSIPTS